MKAICIIGSPRDNGSVAYLMDIIINAMQVGGVEVTKYHLSRLQIHYCEGCLECEADGKCVQDDDMKMLIDEIIKSDAIILASPSYWGDVTGQMKVFIDRSLPLCNAKTGQTAVPAGKIGIGVAIRAGSSKAENLQIIEMFRHYFGHLGIKLAASMTVEGVNNLSDIKNNKMKLEEASDLGKEIAAVLGDRNSKD
jgi:multimeric flavodoxin WrbA